jgi:hypothetical protein
MTSGEKRRLARRGLVGLLAGSLLVVSASAATLEIKKKAGAYDVELRIDRNPPVVGDNALELRITDAAGAVLKDAKVLVNYYMPPMPRMAPMNYKTEAKLKKDAFTMRMRLIMAGPWVIVVKITAGEKTTSARFNIDAR